MNIQIVPDHHDRTAELQVSPYQEITVVLPGEATVGASVMALDARTVDQTAAFAGLEAHQAAIEMRPRDAPLNRTTGVLPVGAQVRARCDVIETAASSSKTSHAPSAAAVALPGARTPSPSRPPPPRPARPPAGQAADTTSRAAAAAPTPRGSTRHAQLVRDQHAYPRQRPALIRPALSHRAVQQQWLEHGEVTVADLRPLGRPRRAQGLSPALTPGPAPPLHRPDADPQLFRDHRVLLTPRKAIDCQHAHPLPHSLALRSETTALRISHGHGVPQGSSNVSPDN